MAQDQLNGRKPEDQRFWDSAGHREALRRVEAWVQLDRECRRFSSANDRIEAVEELEAGRFEYAYDQRGNLTGITEANQRRTTYRYDGNSRLVQVSRQDGSNTGYTYGENDRLVQTDDRGVIHSYCHDARGRPTKIQRGNAGAAVFRYDDQGRVTEARTSVVSTRQGYDSLGRITSINQTMEGVTIGLRLEYDRAGRLARMVLPGGDQPVRYTWDARGRPETLCLGLQRPVARFAYADEAKVSRLHLANGVSEETRADPVDARPLLRRITRCGRDLFRQDYRYNQTGQILDDGTRRYHYDRFGRLTCAEEMEGGSRRHYRYDFMDNRTEAAMPDGTEFYRYDADNRPVGMESNSGATAFSCDRFGRLTSSANHQGQRTYNYNDAGQLVKARYRGDTVACFTYDHKDRLVQGQFSDRTERYLYGPDDELLAVTNQWGVPQLLYLRTPLGALAEIHGSVECGQVYFLHHDHRGTCRLATNEAGDVVARYGYCPFGEPSGDGPIQPMFCGRRWNPQIGMYRFGSRWYDPHLGRFLTPDAYTAAPDDARITNPVWAAGDQAVQRAELLDAWLKRPRCRNPYVYCGNDPLNRSDPNGHWSFGGILLSLLGAIWTLPNTLFGILIEITCLLGEVIRWLVWLATFGHVSWATPGFDVASSGRLNAFALVFRGGWLGSISGLLGMTFGNVFFVNHDWENDSYLQSMPDPVSPSAYQGKTTIPRDQALYEHELRHTNQYGWFGPFFHLGLPIFGVYEWDWICSGLAYGSMWLERDAQEHGGF